MLKAKISLFQEIKSYLFIIIQKKPLVLFALLFIQIQALSQPGNDNCIGAIPLTFNTDGTCNIVTIVDYTGSTSSGVVPTNCTSPTYDIWYSVIVPPDGNFIISRIGSAGTIAVYTGSCTSLTNYIVINSGCYTPLPVAGLIPGTTAYIQIYNGTSGNQICAQSSIVQSLDCGQSFSDLGPGNYPDLTFQRTTICPTISGLATEVTFSSFHVEAEWDALYVYDGPDINGALISSGNPITEANFPAGGYYGTTLPGPFTSTHSSGCLTFVFLSDWGVNFSGWTATSSCIGTPTPIPTLGQWGLIILTLLLLSFSTVAIRSRQLVLAGSHTSSRFTFRQVPFNKILFIKILLPLSVLVLGIFRIAIALFSYELTTSDIPGSLVAVPLLAYLLHLLGGEE